MGNQKLYVKKFTAFYINPGLKQGRKFSFAFAGKLAFLFLLVLFCSTSMVNAQSTAYIYVHQSSVDESSNPTTNTGFGYTVVPSTVGALPLVTTFSLNDAPTTAMANSTFGTANATDVGAASTGTLYSATSSGLYYRTVNTPYWALAAGTSGTDVNFVDGGAYEMAVYATSSGVYIYGPGLTAGIKTVKSISNVKDVAFDRVNSYLFYIDNNYDIWYCKVTPTVVAGVVTSVGLGTITQVKNSIIARRIDADYQGNLFILGGVSNGTNDNNFYKIVAYTATKPTQTSLGQPNGASGTAYDVACGDDGSYYSACTTSGPFGVFKWTGGTNWTNEPQSGVTFNITGGPAGQMWSNYYTNQIWTRLPGTTPNWFDDERVRTSATLPGNSEMIPVTIPAGSTTAQYVITQTANTPTSSWNLQKISIYAAGSSSQTSSVSNSTATVTVTAGQVVHVVYQNYYLATTAFANNCSTSSFTENFGTGSAGSLGALSSAVIGATSYHYFGTSTGSINDGYYGICTNSNDVGYGSNNSLPKTLDHTASSTAAGGLAGASNGNFLFVNASFQTDVFYQREFTGLIPGNPYTITYYIANITGASTVNGITDLIPVNVTAQVTDPTTGTVLGSASSGNITKVGAWTKETFTFTPGASQTTANFSLVNNQVGGNGNDIGLDDISFVLQPSTAVTATVSNVCNGTSTITVTSPLNSVSGISTYQYSVDGTNYQTNPVFTGLAQNKTYTVYSSYVNSTSCASSVTLTPANKYYTWSGASTTSTALTDAANWVGGVAPTLGDENSSIEIPVISSGKYPVLTADASIFSMQIDGGAANINLNGFTLNVGCDIYNATTVPTGSGLTAGTYPLGGVITSGTTDVTTSTINWNGVSSAQKYVGNNTAGSFKMANMTVNNTYNNGAGVVTMSAGPMDIYNVLTLTEGNLTIPAASVVPNTQLTLKSTATQTAALAQIKSPGTGISTPVLTSTSVNVERFITGGKGYRGYRLLSSPVYVNTVNGVNVLGLKYINTSVGSNYGALIGGPGATSSSGFDVSNPNPTIYLYDETQSTNNVTYISGKNIGIYSFTPVNGTFPVNGDMFTTVAVSNANTKSNISIPVGNSYIFYFIGDNHVLTTANTRVPENTTITATGSLNQGTIPFTLWTTKAQTLSFTSGTGSRVAGLNQVGNPYASSIDLNQVYADNLSISPTFYELSEPGQTYISYNASSKASSSTSIGNIVVSGQGFIAGALTTGQALTFNEDQKINAQLVNGGSPALLLSVKLPNVLSGMHLQLTSDADTTANTQTGVYFGNSWSDAYNSSEDAVDLGALSAKVNLSSLTSDGVKVGINELGSYAKNKRVKLYVSAPSSGQYHINMPDAKNIDTLYNIYIVDNLLKDSVNLRGDKRYDFAINTSDTTTYGSNRFVLAVELQQQAPYQLLSFTGQKTSGGIQLQWKTANEGSFTGFTVQKQSGTKFISLDSLQSNGSGAYTYTDVKPTSGVNTYRLMQNGITGAITYSDLVIVNDNALSQNGALTVYPNPTKANVNIYVSLPDNTYKLNIYNSFGGLMKQTTVNGTYWAEDVTSYNAGTYIIEMSDSKGKFVGKTKFIKIK